MRYCHQSVEVQCSYEDALALFGDPMRLPEWAIEYCQSVEREGEGYVAQTVEGRRCFTTRVDAATGLTDVCTGATPDNLDDILYIRLHRVSEETTLINFVYSPPAETPPEVLQQMDSSFRREVEHSKQLLETATAASR